MVRIMECMYMYKEKKILFSEYRLIHIVIFLELLEIYKYQ